MGLFGSSWSDTRAMGRFSVTCFISTPHNPTFDFYRSQRKERKKEILGHASLADLKTISYVLDFCLRYALNRFFDEAPDIPPFGLMPSDVVIKLSVTQSINGWPHGSKRLHTLIWVDTVGLSLFHSWNLFFYFPPSPFPPSPSHFCDKNGWVDHLDGV